MQNLLFMPLNGNIVNIFYNMRATLSSDTLPKMCAVATILAATLALFQCVITTANIMSGKGVSIWDIIKPFIIVVLVANFDTFVIQPVDTIASTISSGLTSMSAPLAEENTVNFDKIVKATNKSLEETASVIDEALQEPEEDEDKASMTAADSDTAKDRSFRKFLRNLFSVTTRTHSGTVVRLFQQAVATVMSWIYNLFYIVWVVFGQFNLLLVCILGPWDFALSLFPIKGVGTPVGDWIAKYIEYSLWSPILNIIDFVVQKGMGMCGLGSLAAGQVTLAAAGSCSVSMIILSLVGIGMMLKTPDLARTLVASSGMGSASSHMAMLAGFGAVRSASKLARTAGGKTIQGASRHIASAREVSSEQNGNTVGRGINIDDNQA